MKTYFLLTKPGIIMGNLITTIAGFALATQGSFDFPLFFITLIGLGLVIASACVCNNYIDRVSDQKMKRTQNRPLAKGAISGSSAILFAIILGLIGTAILFLYTNYQALLVALAGFGIYVIPYSRSKYYTRYATLIGSIAGATPPVVGYVAVSESLDLGALLLFLILILWQMPHFYAITLYRLEDYKRANIPVLPLLKGIPRTKLHMLLYVIAFIPTLLLPTVFGYTGTAYLVVAALLGTSWLILTLQGFKAENNAVWARKMFVLSLVIIVSFSLMVTFS